MKQTKAPAPTLSKEAMRRLASRQAGEIYRCPGCRLTVQAPEGPSGSVFACHHCSTGAKIA